MSPWLRAVRHRPAGEGESGWAATAAPPPPARRLEGDRRAELAVLGAGFTGLAIARRLAELRPDSRVVVVDAGRAGAGASGRSSGFLVDLVDFVSRMEPEARRRYVRVAGEGIASLGRLVAEHGIECSWDERGWLRAAASREGRRFLDSYPPLLDELGIRWEWLDRRAMAEATGTGFYLCGLRLTGYPLVQPAALVAGLARALPANVELYEESPVETLERNVRFHLTTAHGTVSADRLFLATNGYTPALGFLRRRIFPLYTFGSLTRVLSAGEQAALGGEREWGVLAMDPMGSTLRRTRDQRLLVRNTVHYSTRPGAGADLRATVRGHHRRALDARFPALAGVEIEYTWGGLMGTSTSRRHWFGELEPGLYASAGYTGAGIAMGTASGERLAELALGHASSGLRALLDLPRPNPMPPEPLRSAGGRVLAARMNAQAGAYL